MRTIRKNQKGVNSILSLVRWEWLWSDLLHWKLIQRLFFNVWSGMGQIKPGNNNCYASPIQASPAWNKSRYMQLMPQIDMKMINVIINQLKTQPGFPQQVCSRSHNLEILKALRVKINKNTALGAPGKEWLKNLAVNSSAGNTARPRKNDDDWKI